MGSGSCRHPQGSVTSELRTASGGTANERAGRDGGGPGGRTDSSAWRQVARARQPPKAGSCSPGTARALLHGLETELTYGKIRDFKSYQSVVSSIFTGLCNHHH